MESAAVATRTQSNNAIVKFVRAYLSQLVVLAFLIIVVSFSSPYFMTRGNITNIVRQISTNLYMGCALTIIMITGGIDLSTSSVLALGGMVAALITEYAGGPFILALVAALTSGAVIGLINGFIVSRTTIPPFIVTYTMQSVIRGMVYIVTNATVVRLYNTQFLAFGSGFFWIIPLPVIYLIIVVTATQIILKHTKLGRRMYAVGGNERCAQYAGINIKTTRMFIYVTSGVMATLAGLVLTSRTTSMQPTLGVGLEMDAIAAVVLGGTSMRGGQGAVIGTVIGALIIGIINNGLNLMGINSFYQYIVKGIAILLAVYVDYIKQQSMIKR